MKSLKLRDYEGFVSKSSTQCSCQNKVLMFAIYSFDLRAGSKISRGTFLVRTIFVLIDQKIQRNQEKFNKDDQCRPQTLEE